ncbi:MAG: hypothetical protein A2381_06400 [Bdellovibrionales bacterium RIFOXYB1_FULL_37_110]|nr:MAG: hypothetical protein A2181_08420 [Bdellovibrionales bacterium RIFOXYA1_FULL_38_20]OFZ50172.1 MAG: hypothetical protein A2417_19250 [Bdellovibrionales bacterium RIFOXYC1_FULL_37_79]OFZ57609.1 MAG: hypothetical protein A2381_06400 [Bdellovibrionales bacterium RIFOXYB1_FULL_37_110]OFZ61323.1 MAG: hypothetical protein A2328_05890 [Bdellovibrionales bacterium RIFOXYB2_FULL_36_6]OFZ61376.1 MAG: hypothetical protein A2577_00765 [Bdellovibrionales bacterium RIFOXYD1_FULL_36_51]
MDRVLNLIKSDYKETQKRILPRFPFTYLTFKDSNPDCSNHVFEVKDISYTGMQLIKKDGKHGYEVHELLEGELHWKGTSLRLKGQVKWVNENTLGVGFSKDIDFKESIQKFFSVENIISSMKSVHKAQMDIEIPANLRYWIRGDGQVEVFVWQHNDHEFMKFVIIFLRRFVEWEDAKGIQSGKIIVNRDIDTPLSQEDEFVFEIDQTLDPEKIDFSLQLVRQMTEDLLPSHVQEFLLLKLGL